MVMLMMTVCAGAGVEVGAPAGSDCRNDRRRSKVFGLSISAFPFWTGHKIATVATEIVSHVSV